MLPNFHHQIQRVLFLETSNNNIIVNINSISNIMIDRHTTGQLFNDTPNAKTICPIDIKATNIARHMRTPNLSTK